MFRFEFKSAVTGALLLSSLLIQGCGKSESQAGNSLSQKPTSGEFVSEAEDLETTRKSREAQVEALEQLKFQINSSLSCRFASAIAKKPVGKKIALTFDDGPEPTLTPELLKVLDKYNIKATFFVTGKRSSARPDLVKWLWEKGHIVANHSKSHPNFHTISDAAARAEIDSTESLIESFMMPEKFFRYPYGNSTCATNQYLKKNNYKIVGWHVDSCDWGFNATGRVSDRDAKICGVSPGNRNSFVNHVVATTVKTGGGILLMHDVQKIVIDNIEEIIQQLLARGFEFVELDDESFEGMFF